MHANDLILFSQVVELGSFKKAAELNNITNSVVSKRITQLEQALNAQLLYRTTRSLALTEAGKKLASSADMIKHITQEAIDDITDDNETLSGHIKMSVPTISGDLLLGEAVAEFCHLHPNLSVNMSLDNRFVNPLEEGYDLIIRTGLLEDSSLIARHIINSSWVICCSPDYLTQYGRPASPAKLSEHHCLIYLYQTAGAYNWIFKNDGQQFTVTVNGAFASDNASALRKAALSGQGIMHVPKCLVHEDLISGNLVSLFDDEVDKTIGVYALHPFIKKTPRKILALVEHIKQAYLAKGAYFSAV
ncbi:MAG: LysR family transcriptional regulator [Glaciecola sp.]|jgi:DNA-binding transcriptional LysR family regulator